MSSGSGFVFNCSFSLRAILFSKNEELFFHYLCLYWHFVSRDAERLASNVSRKTVNFEEDSSGSHNDHIVIDVPFAASQRDFRWKFRDWLIGENANP